MSDAEFDIVIRRGQVVDGGGGDPVDADVGVRDGRIAAVGRDLGRGREEIDAQGLLVTPGFIDAHTHYDGQATWDSHLEPSSAHGVTTGLMGNCGVGFAPCRPADRDALIELMEGVEDIPGVALAEGLPWNWEGFPEYLDSVDSRPHDIDLVAHIPHGALRVFVMGARGLAREPARPDDIAAMQRLVDDGMRAGAIGLATSRTIAHRTIAGELTPMYGAARAELAGLCSTIGPRGVFQMVSDFADEPAEFELLKDAARQGVRQVCYSLLQTDGRPDMWRSLLDRTEAANAEGLPVRAQVICRPVGVLMGLQASLHPFRYRPTYLKIADLPLEDRVRAMRDPAVRSAILSEADASSHPLLSYYVGGAEKLYPLGDPPDYTPPAESSFGAQARRLGRDPGEVIYDYLLEDDGRTLIYLPLYNYVGERVDAIRDMLAHPHTLQGLADGGAHVGAIADASAPTYLLSHWVRDTGQMRLGDAIEQLTWRQARAFGLEDRGLVRPGYKADLNIIDLGALGVARPRMVSDLPAGGSRLLQASRGYRATIMSGVVTRRDGEATGALPGRVVRGMQPPPGEARS